MLRAITSSLRLSARVTTPRSLPPAACLARSMSLQDNVYETDKMVQEYLAFHFGQDDGDYMPYEDSPVSATNFNVRIADLCFAHAPTGAGTRALDIGCAVGRACFELGRSFEQVVGIDYSQAFIDACNELKDKGTMKYQRLDEGANFKDCVATIPADLNRESCTFQQGDACSLPTDLGKFDLVLMANLICRLPTPQDCLDRLPELVKPGGVVVITSPFSWLPQFTEQQNWLGGYDGKESRDGLVNALTAKGEFEVIDESHISFLIREHRRKYQLVYPHLLVCRRTA